MYSEGTLQQTPQRGLHNPARIRRRARMLQNNENLYANNHNQLNSHNQSNLKLLEADNKIYSIDRNSEKKILKSSNSNAKLGGKHHGKVTLSEKNNYQGSESSDGSKELVIADKQESSQRMSITSFVGLTYPDARQNMMPVTSESLKFSQKSKVLATLLPDEILRDSTNRKNRTYNTAVIFPDVSGFTQLCEKYDKTGKGGPSRLTEVLNGYIGSMIQIVMSRNGDVLKFGGDAFLCVWKVSSDSDIKEIVYSAIESAVDIQKNCGEHKTDVGVKLGVKIAVAAGRAVFSVIGTDSRKHYVLVGPPVFDVREAEHLGRPGDVIVAPSAWQHVENYMLYSYTYHSNNTHIRVHDFGPLWKPIPNISDKGDESIRPLLKYSSQLKVEDLRPFILTPVMKSIDLNQSLDYLTEMRQVAIVFFNITADFEDMSIEDLIELSHRVFQIVALYADKSDGAVNKLTLFDKDMAILVVFGLKGFKHELASQVALKYAYNCIEQLKKLPISSASAGVTTGMAYCGVIGHRLRREYTVMGRPVNLAARLMCTYSNIVSTDRDTFLHSKLECSHFDVLEQRLMKGIQSTGPFYKFNLQLKKRNFKLDYYAYPLLGRGKEIREFETFLQNSLKNKNVINFFVIYGAARIGKSRLVAALINITEKKNIEIEANSESKRRALEKPDLIEINVISLTEDDLKSSFNVIRLIFHQPLGFSDPSSVEEREDKIISKLGEFKDIYLLPCFNPIFNVNFDLMPAYLTLSQQEQLDQQRALVTLLYNKCFPKGTRWVIAIEDAEFMDDESWMVLEWCGRESNTILYLLTIGQRRSLTGAANKCLAYVYQTKINLTEIEKWYFSGLACQILGVRAIPVELENLMQSYKSSGNPGWLESFLLSLIQSNSIYINQATVDQIKNMRLVSAPPEMLSTSQTPEDEKHDESHWTDFFETFEKRVELTKKYSVCLLGPNFFNENKTETDLTMDIMLVKTIDTLKPLEQLVLKTGCVLGNNFKRSALKYLIGRDSKIDERLLAKAIRNLFIIKILTCAKGDMSHSNVIVPRKMILVSSIRKEIVCECVGLVIPEECKDLPQYANCGYMQFRSPIFRDTVYSLLLDDQKKKYHNSSIEYFRLNTYRCESCRNVPFKNVLGSNDQSQLKLMCTISPMHGVRSIRLDPNTEVPIRSIRKKLCKCCTAQAPVRKFSQAVETVDGLTSFGKVADCQCADILSSAYSVLLEHATGAGRKDIMVEIQLEYASLSLTTYNIPLTMQILEDALALVNQMKEDKEYLEICTPYVFSKIYALMGATKLSMGRPDNSLEFLEKSLQYMKKKMPKRIIEVKLLTKKESMRRKLMTEYFPEILIGQISDKEACWCDLLSECLGLITSVHMHMEDWQIAKYAAGWALNEALRSNRNFYGLCTAYTNMMDVAYHFKDLDTCSKMEICAIDVCQRCTKKIVETYELEAICRLFRVIFQTRHMRAEIEEAVYIGFQSIKIASEIRSTSLRLDLMPDLIFALVQLNRLAEAASLLQELEFTSQLDSDKSSRIWYYALCLDFQLDTGFTVIPFENCQNFVKEEEETFSTVRDPDSKHRLFTSLWLWCVRHSEWELSKSFAKTLYSYNLLDSKETPSTVYTRLKRLEGHLITLVHQMDTRNIHAITSTYGNIDSLMSRLERDMKVVKVLKSRYMILKAYYRQIKYRDDGCFRILNQALSLSEKLQDRNTNEWITHLKMVWNNATSPIHRDYWIEHCRYNLVDWHEAQSIPKKHMVMFSLPLPKF